MTRLLSKIIILFWLLSPSLAIAKDLGIFGITYPVAEMDASEEIRERAKAVDWAKYFDKKTWKKKIQEYKPPNLTKLPIAKEDRTFQVDMTYSSEFDVSDADGNIIYPKGYTFNPLEYLFFPKTLVFIDGTDKKQVEWFKKSPYEPDINTMLLLVDGSYYKLSKELKRPAFYADKMIIERLKIQAVPSVAVQNGIFMQVREYVPEKVKK